MSTPDSLGARPEEEKKGDGSRALADAARLKAPDWETIRRGLLTDATGNEMAIAEDALANAEAAYRLVFDAVHLSVCALAVYIVPDSGISDHQVVGRLLEILDDRRLAAFLRITLARPEAKPGEAIAEPEKASSPPVLPEEAAEVADPVDWERTLWDAAEAAGFGNRMSLHYLHTFAKAIRSALAEAGRDGGV